MEKLIMLVSNDKYELPIAIANSANEMSRIIGLQENSIKKLYMKIELIENIMEDS